jgi:hypothetical protein
MLGPEGGKALAVGLKGNRTITELNIATNHLGINVSTGEIDTAGVIAIADAIRDMRALLYFDISDNDIRADGGNALVGALKGNQVITTLIIAKNDLSYDSYGAEDMSGVAALADAIPGMRALLVLSLQSNDLCAAGGKVLAEGLKDNQVITELNIASNRLGLKTHFDRDGADVSGIKALADAIPDMRALTCLNLASNSLGVEGAKIIAACLPKCT